MQESSCQGSCTNLIAGIVPLREAAKRKLFAGVYPSPRKAMGVRRVNVSDDFVIPKSRHVLIYDNQSFFERRKKVTRTRSFRFPFKVANKSLLTNLDVSTSSPSRSKST
jgi:hypothetical protein